MSKTTVFFFSVILVACVIVAVTRITFGWWQPRVVAKEPIKEWSPYPKTNGIRIEVNVNAHPYNAIPDDDLPDTEAFQLALDVVKSLKHGGIFDTLTPVLIVRPGRYIIDKSLNNDQTTFELIPEYATFELKGNNMAISNMTFIYR